MMKFCVFIVLLTISTSVVRSAVVKKNTDEDDKINDIKAKLVNLQRLLKQLGKEKAPPTVVTTTESVTKKPIVVAKQPVNTKTEDDAVIELLDKLTPQEIKLLKKLQGDLAQAKQSLLEKNKKLKESQSKDKASVKHVEKTESRGIFGNFVKPIKNVDNKDGIEIIKEEDELSAFEKKEHASQEKKENEGKDNKVLEEVEERIVSDIRYAKAHGISMKQLFEGMQQKRGH